MRVFGLTGGIASGKGVVASRFRRRGLPVVDADRLARDVVRPGTDGHSAVVSEFGPSFVLATGEIDRSALAGLVFSDTSRLRALQDIIHPLVAEALARTVSACEREGHYAVCYESPLLVETGLADSFRPVVVVAASESVQAARASARDGITLESAYARIAAQCPLSEKLKVADFVVSNDGPLTDTYLRADRVLDSVLSLLGVPPSRYPPPTHS